MIFFAGILLVFVAVGMAVNLLRHLTRPKTTATVEELVSDSQIPQARVAYVVDGSEHSGTIPIPRLLKADVGGKLEVTYAPSSPDQSRIHAPLHELGAIATTLVVALAMIGVSVYVAS